MLANYYFGRLRWTLKYQMAIPIAATAINQPIRPQNSPSGAMVRLLPLHPYYHSAVRNVRFGSLADITHVNRNVRFTPESGH